MHLIWLQSAREVKFFSMAQRKFQKGEPSAWYCDWPQSEWLMTYMPLFERFWFMFEKKEGLLAVKDDDIVDFPYVMGT